MPAHFRTKNVLRYKQDITGGTCFFCMPAHFKTKNVLRSKQDLQLFVSFLSLEIFCSQKQFNIDKAVKTAVTTHTNHYALAFKSF